MNDDFSSEYSEKSLWVKIKGFSVAAGKEIIEKVLLLYYVLEKDDVPKVDKAKIIAALGYFISPLDAIPDLTPLIGYSDDLGVLVLALSTITKYLDDDVRKKAEERLKEWFGE